MLWHWFLHFTGADNVSGTEYGFWSGFGSDLTEFTVVLGLLGVYRKHQCHIRWCWRLGHHDVGPYKVCRRHHPRLDNKPPTAGDLHGSSTDSSLQ